MDLPLEAQDAAGYSRNRACLAWPSVKLRPTPSPFALTSARRWGFFLLSVSGKGEQPTVALTAGVKTRGPALRGEREGRVKGERERD